MKNDLRSRLSSAESGTLIDELLAAQRDLTAVERFSQQHDLATKPYARFYEDLIPLNKPGVNEQYAFAVDLDACTGCKACVSACHSLNGLDEDEIWRTVGLIHSDTADHPYQQTVTSACHHCEDPACANGCPVLAYEKDAETGIVRHLDDQCIGCQYCILKCPYDVPKYSAKRGIVRKCDMCSSRLSAGEAPACVQACPNEAIRIEVVNRVESATACLPETSLVAGAFSSNYTKPTTRYFSDRVTPAKVHPANQGALQPEHAHWPLIGMLILTQAGIGTFLLQILSYFQTENLAFTRWSTFSGALLLFAGLGVSVLHLGRPLKAWRAFLGLRKSWMSREIVGFSALGGLASALVAAELFGFPQFKTPLLFSFLLLGALSLFCSVMIYADTHREFWSLPRTLMKFSATTLGLGATVNLTVMHFTGNVFDPTLTWIFLGVLSFKFLIEAVEFKMCGKLQHPVYKLAIAS